MPEHLKSLELLLGHEDWGCAVQRATVCQAFRPDVEEEQIADEKVSCYNCRYRRWIQAGISCAAQKTTTVSR